MELMEKQGYKKTEIGFIPRDWEVESFGDVADKRIKNSITGGPFGSNLKTTDYTPDGIQIIQLQNIGDGKFIDESVVYTSIAKAEELKSCNIYAGEIILSKMGDPVARACLMPSKASRYLMASDGIRLVVDEKRYDKKFVFNYINSKYFRNRAIDISTGSTRQRIGLPDLKGLKFIKPPLSEQKNIAIALSDVDEIISNLDKLIAKKKVIKQGAMQQLLTPPHKGGKRLEGYNGEWEEKIVGEIADYKNGTAHENCVVENGKFIIVNSKFVSTEGKVAKFSNKNLAPVNNGEILMVLSDIPNGKAIAKCFFVEEDNKYTLNQRICSFKTEKVNPRFLYLLLNRNPYYLQFDDGVKQTNLRNQDVLSCPICIPPSKKEQEQISTIIFDLQKDIELAIRKKQKYQSVKQGMMQELLTGKTRLI